MRISRTYLGKEEEWESSHSEVIIGRVEDRSGRSLDLTPDWTNVESEHMTVHTKHGGQMTVADVRLTTGREYRIQLREFA